jgi:flagellar hook-associated protein 2
MTSVTTVDGLVSGMQTSSIISQLMQIEAQPQTNLKNQVTSENKIISSYQSVNTKMAALKTAAEALTSSVTNTAWQAVTTTSSSTAVTASAVPGTAPGSLTFDVKQLAATHVVTASNLPAAGVTGGAGFDISYGMQPLHVGVTDDSPQGVADAINGLGLSLKATVLTTDQGTVLQVASTESGAAGAFTLTGIPGAQIAVQGKDAQISVGSGAGAYTLSSTTNTFTNVMPGVTINATAKQDGVTVTVGTDADSIATKMQALVDAANTALTEIGTQTAYDTAKKTGAPLSGDFTVRQLQSQLLSSISSGSPAYGSFKQLGVQLDRDGKITFDKSAFLAAYSADPASVQSAVADPDGLAGALDTVAVGATDFSTGSLTTALQSHNAQVSTLNTQISDWDTRLAAKQDALQRQFANLETALGKMKDQSNWLASQLGSLPTSSSSSS